MPPDSIAAKARQLLEHGCALLNANDPSAAVEELSEAARFCPDTPAILERLAEAYHRAGQLLPALKTYDRLIELDAATESVWCATGNALSDCAEHAQAIGAYDRCLALNDQNAESHHNLARALYRLGEVSRAVEHLDAATAQCDAINSWLSLATMLPGCPEASHETILKVRREYAARLKPYAPKSQLGRTHRGTPQDRPLRIGYISAFFDRQNYMKPVWGLINHHDRSSFEVHLFSDCSKRAISGYVPDVRDRVHETQGLDNQGFATLIQSCDIDILVDLNAYSTPERLPLFLHRLAPVTVAWFNMYATSGLPAFDYIVGDDQVVRPEEESFYCERVRRLPVSYLTFEVTHAVPPIVPPPCVQNRTVTFGSLVTQYKITPRVLDAWSEILNRTSGTRLLLANTVLKSPQNRAWLKDRFAERGVAVERLSLHGPAEHYEFLQYYDAIDVALDAFPYNGGTTTMEALWQGVPVLTFDGDRWASRTSQSLIRNTHLSDFVRRDLQDYIAFAIELAESPDTPMRLAELRHSMRRRLETSPACNTTGLAAHMERLYRQMWQEPSRMGLGR